MLVPFLFAIPNLIEMQTKGKINTLILKTIAVLPEYEDLGLGNVMTRKIAKLAIDKGYRDWIFAFMYKDNTSQKLAKRNGTSVIREYALYGKDL
jgi:ribosomal protein S18 acetylase RimI-like enzyme